MVKKVREGYKMTELGEIPEEWEIKRLDEITEKITDGSHNSPVPIEESIYKICTVSNMEKQELNIKTSASITMEDFNKLCLNGCNPILNDVLLSKDGTVGKTLVFTQDRDNIVLLSSIAIIRPIKNTLNSIFLKQYLSDSSTLQMLLNMKTGSAIKRIVLRDIKALKVVVPNIVEQQKIASILSSVDDQIETTDNLIEKTKELKKGLMQKLLIKGIGHEKFKDTEIGRIPEEWSVVRIKDISDTTSGGTPSRSHKEYYENGTIPWLKTGELNNKYIFDTEEKITEKAVQNSSAKLIPINSVLIAMYGATIGKTSIAKNVITTNQACCAILCDDKLLDYEFLYYILSFNKNNLIELGAGGAQPNISQMIIRDYKVAVPSLLEQQKIASILSSVDNQIEEYQAKKEKLEELKKGLMQKLLTGKIRVKI